MTKAYLRSQPVDFNRRVLMTALYPDAFPLTEENGKAHVLKQDRRLSNSAPPLILGTERAGFAQRDKLQHSAAGSYMHKQKAPVAS